MRFLITFILEDVSFTVEGNPKIPGIKNFLSWIIREMIEI